MKYNILIVFNLCFFISTFPEKHHTRQYRTSKEHHSKKDIKNHSLTIKEIEIHPGDTVCLDGVDIPKSFVYFCDFYPITIHEFMSDLIEKYAVAENEKKLSLKSNFVAFSPEEAWDFLNNCEYFNEDFIDALNIIFSPDKFALLYRTRLTIEFLIFAFDTKQKQKVFPYTYAQNLRLKGILRNIEEFVITYRDKFSEILSDEQINAFNKFLHKYLTMAPKNISYMTFLQELAAFKDFIGAFSNSKGNSSVKELSYREKISIYNRFSTIVKI